MGKKKLAYVLHGISLGGVEVALVSAIPRLVREFELRVFCLGRIDSSLVSHLSSAEKAVIVSIPYTPARFLVTMATAISLLLRFNPDLMICSLWRASAVGVVTKLLRKKIRFFSFIHNTVFFHPLDRLFTRQAISIADSILADSQATRRFIVSNFHPNATINVVSFFTHPSPSRRIVTPPLPGKETKFIFLGRVNAVKNIPLSIDVIRHLRMQGIPATLDIYGTDGGAWEEVAAYIKDNHMEGNVHLKNGLDPTARFGVLKQYSFLIQLSKAEGMAMSVAEAMQLGIVCVVTPVGEIPNYSTDGHSAVIIYTDTLEAWEASLQKVENVVRNAHLYESISKSCYDNFREAVTYTDSLLSSLCSA